MTLHQLRKRLKACRAGRQTIHASLKDGEKLTAGRLQIEPVGLGVILIRVDDGLTIGILNDGFGGVSVDCYTDGNDPIIYESARKFDPSADPPLVKFGPGGEYTTDYTPDDPLDAHRLISGEPVASPH